MLLSAIAGKRARALLPYLGCGCASGPSARSLPAAFGSALLFGPVVAVARVFAATVVARLRPSDCAHRHDGSPLDDLLQLAPSAAIAALVMYFAPLAQFGSRPAMLQIAAGVLFGFLASPCALGSVAIAGALRAQSPIAAGAYLCVAGIADLHAVRPAMLPRAAHDGLAYALLASAAFAVALKHGAALVHPRLAVALGIVAPVAALLAFAHRRAICTRARFVPAALVVALVLGAPQPQYRATETTLTDAFAGERIDFTGALVRSHGTATLVRYAITCCRADAQPVAVLLATPVNIAARTWIHATGVLRVRNGAIALVPDRLWAVAPPLDPFVYR